MNTLDFVFAKITGQQVDPKDLNPECTGDIDSCPDAECLACGYRECPHKEPLHYHHDGCPSCLLDMEKP